VMNAGITLRRLCELGESPRRTSYIVRVRRSVRWRTDSAWQGGHAQLAEASTKCGFPTRSLPEPTVYPETGAGTRRWSPRAQAARASVIRHSRVLRIFIVPGQMQLMRTQRSVIAAPRSSALARWDAA